jgi:glucokinase
MPWSRTVAATDVLVAASGPARGQDGGVDRSDREEGQVPFGALAIDIGGTKVAAAVVTHNGDVLARRQEPTDHRSAEALYRQVVGLASAARDEAGDPTGAGRAAHADPCRVVVCGVGCGGPARDGHRLMSPLNIAVWRDFPLRDRLGTDLGVEVHVDNDAKAFTRAEGWLGAAAGVDDYLAMVVSTGVGGGIVSNGRLLEGADGNAGHVGHLFVDPDGGPDALGVRGLLEGSASGTGIARITGRPAAEADLATRRRTGVLVGRAVAGVANLLDLRLAVVGGSVALGFGADFFDAAQQTLDELCLLDHSRGARIVPAGLGADAPLIGAAAVGFVGAGVELRTR